MLLRQPSLTCTLHVCSVDLFSVEPTPHPAPASLTSLFTGEGEDNDVVKRPGVVGVWRVEGQVPGRGLPQVNEEGRVHHGNCEAASAVSFPDGDVGRGALIVALQEDGVRSGALELSAGSVKASEARMGCASSTTGIPEAM